MTSTVITSAKNPLLQEVKAAVQRGRPLGDGSLAIEGPHLVAEVLKSRWEISRILITPELRPQWESVLRGRHAELIEVGQRALEAVGDTETTQGLLALVKPPKSSSDMPIAPGGVLLVLDGIQDPGNAGALVRSAEAFGASAVIACGGSVRLANPKFLRATAGSIFRMPFEEQWTPDEVLTRFRGRVLALAAAAALRIDEVDLRQGCVLVVGNEGGGVSKTFLSKATPVSVPIGNVESLNAAIAGSIALYEAARQRRSR